MRFGDDSVTPLGLTANKLDRMAFISNVIGITSVYFYDTAITSDMMIVS